MNESTIKKTNLFASALLAMLSLAMVIPLMRTFPNNPGSAWLLPAVIIVFSFVLWCWAEHWMPFVFKFWAKRGVGGADNGIHARKYLRAFVLFVNISIILALAISLFSYATQGKL